MSHFTVLVIGENPQKQLAPFQENNMGDCPKKYLVFRDDEPEHRESYETDTTSVFVDIYGAKHSKYSERFKVFKGVFETEYVCPNGWSEMEIPVKDLFPTFDEYMREYCGYEKDNLGRYGCYYNPNAKWDWYKLGGRWTGFFKLKKGLIGITGQPGLLTTNAEPGYADQCFKKDIDFEAMRNDSRDKAISTYDTVMNIFGELPINKSWEEIRVIDKIDNSRDAYWNQPRCIAWQDAIKNDKELFHNLFNYSPDDFLISKEVYVQSKIDAAIATFAVIKNGQWYEKGKMGWWCVVSDKIEEKDWLRAFNNWIDDLPGDTLMSVYDCHI